MYITHTHTNTHTCACTHTHIHTQSGILTSTQRHTYTQSGTLRCTEAHTHTSVIHINASKALNLAHSLSKHMVNYKTVSTKDSNLISMVKQKRGSGRR